MKKTLLLGSIIAGVVALAPGVASAAQGIGGCSLDGSATLTPGLTSNQPAGVTPTAPAADWAVPQEVNWGGTAFNYSFSGALSNCNGGSPGGLSGVKSGNIYAGTPITIDGVSWDWPFATPSGKGGCTGSHTSGTSVVVWNDGKLSVIDYATDGAAAGIQLMGQIRDGSVTLSRPGPPDANGNPTTISQSFPTEFNKDYVGGPLVFHPMDPQDCAGSGVKTAPITGVIGHGNYS